MDHIARVDLDPFATTETWAVQVTAQTSGSKGNRKKKMATLVSAWPQSWRVSLVTQETVQDPANRSRNKYYWRVEDYVNGEWREPIAVEFDMKAVKAIKIVSRAAKERESAADESVANAMSGLE